MKFFITSCVSIVGIFIMILFTAQLEILNISKLAGQVIASQSQNIYQECIKSFSQEKKSNFIISKENINSDGKEDAIVQYKNELNCGSAGCVFEICLSTSNNAYTHLPFGYAGESLKAKQTVTNDMADLMLNNDESLILTWNGSSYELFTTNY